MGAIFRFLGLCVCLGVQRGLSRVLIKYSGNYVKIYFNMKITYLYICFVFLILYIYIFQEYKLPVG